MGIRFRCPNGHKLNVKSFLAGKRGVCPYCRAKFQIPTESASEKLVSAASPADGPIGQDSAITSANTKSSEHPAAQPNPETALSDGGDPISEAPHAVWYVRAPSGGQFGPASGDIMRTWIADGRVSGNSLIWRQGWGEWKAAVDVFPVLSEDYSDIEESTGQTLGVPKIVATSGRLGRKRSKRSKNTAVILLGLACLILFVVLVIVIQRNS